MTISKHTYEASLTAGSSYPLGVIRDGSLTMDEAWSPHVQAEIVTPIPSPTVQDLIDPRVPGRRAVVTLEADYSDWNSAPIPATTRTADLALRGRVFDHDSGTVRISLESDECLLQDWKMLSGTPDSSAFAYQSSLRAIINNVVLSKIGATLEAGTADAPFQVVADSTNQFSNPSLEVSGTGWIGAGVTATVDGTYGADGSTKSLRLSSPTSSDAFATLDGDSGALRNGMQAGRTYTVSANFRMTSAQSGSIHTRARRMVLFYKNSVGSVIEVRGQQAPNAAGAVRLADTFTIPAGSTEAWIRFYHGSTVGTVWWDSFRLSEGDGITIGDTGYFDGGTAATALYSYAWTGTAGLSTSARTALIDRSPDLLYWAPGVSAWDFVQPLFQAAGLRLYCDEQRRWWLVDTSYLADGITTFAVGVNATVAQDSIDRNDNDSGWFDAVLVKYTWLDSIGTAQTAYDIATLPGYSKPLYLEIDRASPGPGAADYILSRATGKGRQLNLESVSSYSTQPTQPVIATLPGAPIQTGVVSAVSWNLSNDEMKVTTRGLTDTPPSAWVFLSDSESWLDSPVGASWLSETI